MVTKEEKLEIWQQIVGAFEDGEHNKSYALFS